MKIFHECEQTGVRMLRVCGHHVARTNRLAFQQLIDVLKIRDYNRNRCREFFQLFFFSISRSYLRNKIRNSKSDGKPLRQFFFDRKFDLRDNS